VHNYERCTNLDLLRTRNDNKVISLLKNPSESDLSWCCIVLFANLSEAVDDLVDLGKVFL
jgi:hypothetical protein